MAPIRGNKKRKSIDINDVQVPEHGSITPAAPPPLLPSTLPPSPILDWWNNHFSKRLTSGPQSVSYESVTIESYVKLSFKTFDYICSLVNQEIMKRHSKITDLKGNLLSANDRVAIALRRLSSADSCSYIGKSLGIHQSNINHLTWTFIEVMEEKALHHLNWPSTDDKAQEIKHNFEKIQGLPNCCGAIDTTHVLFRHSITDPSNKVWRDEEKNHSMILQAIVDPDMRFLNIITGLPGSLSDFHALQNWTFFQLSQTGKRLNGKRVKLSKELKLREYIIGDSGFPLLPWLLTPYQGESLSDIQERFNKKLLTTQMVAQKAFAKLKKTWKIINRVLWMPNTDRLPRIILVCCLLHNIAIDLHDVVQERISVVSEFHDPNYKEQVNDYIDETGSVEREMLARYLSRSLPPKVSDNSSFACRDI